jgi:hypothetical protein
MPETSICVPLKMGEGFGYQIAAEVSMRDYGNSAPSPLMALATSAAIASVGIEPRSLPPGVLRLRARIDLV